MKHQPQTASEWFARMNTGARVSSEDQLAFRNWLSADAAHAAKYRACEASWAELGAFADRPEIQSRRAAIEGEFTEPTRRAWLTGAGGAIAASAAGAVALVAITRPSPALAQYVTAAGERRQARLPDGSTMTLAPASRAASRFVRRDGLVTLQLGQAFFSSPEAGLNVETAGLRAVAEGGAFQVTLVGSEPELVVVSGALKVGGVRLLPGQRLWRSDVSTVDTAALTEWRDGRLTFRDRPLREVVAAFNRYSADQFVLARPDLGDRRLSGSFRYTGVQDFPQALEDVLSLTVAADGPRRWVIS